MLSLQNMCMVPKGDLEKDGEFCAYICHDFLAVLEHLKHQHNMDLHATRDYCGDCEVIFSDRLDLTQHYLAKILSSEEFDLVCETPRTNLDLSLWLVPIFNKLRELLKEVMSKLMFDENCPPLENGNSHIIM